MRVPARTVREELRGCGEEKREGGENVQRRRRREWMAGQGRKVQWGCAGQRRLSCARLHRRHLCGEGQRRRCTMAGVVVVDADGGLFLDEGGERRVSAWSGVRDPPPLHQGALQGGVDGRNSEEEGEGDTSASPSPSPSGSPSSSVLMCENVFDDSLWLCWSPGWCEVWLHPPLFLLLVLTILHLCRAPPLRHLNLCCLILTPSVPALPPLFSFFPVSFSLSFS